MRTSTAARTVTDNNADSIAYNISSRPTSCMPFTDTTNSTIWTNYSIAISKSLPDTSEDRMIPITQY